MGDEFGALVKSFEKFQAEQQESPQKDHNMEKRQAHGGGKKSRGIGS